MATIFISSTTADLQEHRAAVLKALVAAGHQPVLLEHMPADGMQPPLGVSRSMIDEADALLAIVAWRYGFVPVEDNPEGFSFVELEVRHAWQTNKPTIIFMVSQDYPWPPRFVDTGESLLKLERFRRTIMKERLVQMFTTPDELAAMAVLAVSSLPPPQRNLRPGSAPRLPPTIDPFELAWRLVVDRQAEHSLLLHMDMTQLLEGVRKVSEGGFEQPATAEDVLRALRAKQTNLHPDPLWLAWMRATSPLASTPTPPPSHA